MAVPIDQTSIMKTAMLKKGRPVFINRNSIDVNVDRIQRRYPTTMDQHKEIAKQEDFVFPIPKNQIIKRHMRWLS